MKKQNIITFLIFTLTCFQLSAQDLDFISSLNNSEVSNADKLVKNIIGESQAKYKLLKVKNKASKRTYYFIPKSVTETEVNSLQVAKRVFLIQFYVIKKQDGSETLKLKQVRAPFEDLFGSWKKFFHPSADLASIEAKKNLQHFKKAGFYFSIYKKQGFKDNVWQLLNKS